MPIKYRNLKIDEKVKKLLDLSKGNLTYSDYLNTALTYFEMTGVDPKSGLVPPVQIISKVINDMSTVLYKRMDDNIKILRNIEQTRLIPIAETMENLLKGKESEPLNITPNDEEVFKVVKINKELEDSLRKKDEEINELKRRLMKYSDNITKVVNTVDELLSDRILHKKSDKEYILTVEHRKQLIEKISQYIDVQ